MPMAITHSGRGRVTLALAACLASASAFAQEMRAPEDWTGQTDSATEDVLAGARLIDSVVALVGRRVITLSQLRTEARVALADHAALEAAQGTLQSAVLGSTLEYIISEDLVEEEASRLQVFPVTLAECQIAEEGLAARFPTRDAFESFLSHFDIDHERLRAILQRKLRASRYLENRLRIQSQPTDVEVDALLASGTEDPTVPRERSLAKAYLQRQKYQILATALVQELRARADVRILSSFGTGVAGGSGTVAPPALSGPTSPSGPPQAHRAGDAKGSLDSAHLDPRPSGAP
jgi:hypothetical protein